MRTLRIGLVCTDLHPAGTERCVYQLARGLHGQGFEVCVLALRGGAVEGWLKREGIDVTVLGVRSKSDVFRIRRAVRWLRAFRPDLLHTHLFHADLVTRLAVMVTRPVPLVHTVHAVETRWRPWQFTFQRFTAGQCARIVAVSQAVAQHHAHRVGLPLHRYDIIPNGIDTARFTPAEQALRAAARAELDLSADAQAAIFVGRLHPDKGVDVLLSAMRTPEMQHRNMVLFVVGDGPQRQMVQQVADASAGRIRWLGWRDDVPRLLAAGDVAVVPSRCEGFGLAALEAMASGLPVVTTNVGGLEEVVKDHTTGLVVPSEDPVSLGRALGRLLDDPALRSRLGRAGTRRAGQHFSLDAFLHAHRVLYARVVANAESR